MTEAIRRRMAARTDEDRQGGFTLIELMVVVMIIAILVGIAIPAFLGARKRAQDTASKSNLRNALGTAQTIFTDNQAYLATAARGHCSRQRGAKPHVRGRHRRLDDGQDDLGADGPTRRSTTDHPVVQVGFREVLLPPPPGHRRAGYVRLLHGERHRSSRRLHGRATPRPPVGPPCNSPRPTMADGESGREPHGSRPLRRPRRSAP